MVSDALGVASGSVAELHAVNRVMRAKTAKFFIKVMVFIISSKKCVSRNH